MMKESSIRELKTKGHVVAKGISNCCHNLTVKLRNLFSLYFAEKGACRFMITNVLVDKC